MRQSILISGAKGFLASHLKHLLKEDFQLFGIAKEAENAPDIEIFSSKNLDEINVKPDFVILCHAAVASGNTSLSEKELFDVNVSLTEKLVQKFSSSKIIYISTTSVYENNGVIQENSSLQPQSVYAASKLVGEAIVAKSENWTIIRLSSLFGNGMKENTIIPNYVNQALQNDTIEVWGKGERKQNYISVSDASKYVKKAVENFEKITGKIQLAVNTTEYSNSDLAQIIAENTHAKVVFVNDDNSKSFQYNNNLTCELLNWTPNSNFATDIQNYIQWKRKQS